MKLYNSLGKSLQDFNPVKQGEAGIYSCGPTVYWNQHIGHMYAYVQWDILIRTLRFIGYQTKWVMNITDVGHMTSDEDSGEDKMEKGAKREGLTVWDLAKKYTDQFTQSLQLLNIMRPDVLCKATEHIDEQIELARLIEKNGYTYRTDMGLVFDTSKFPDYPKFAGLNLKKQQKRVDVENDPQKKLPWDFFLWVTGNKNHIMQWDSPWGKGYPGWHLECTAMSTKYLGKKFDIHTGGIEHIGVHHTNEIAQGYGAFGDYTANYWLHNAWLLDNAGEKMSKSSGKFVTVQEVVEKGYDPLSLRYLFLNSHYRKGLKFSWETLSGSQNAINNLRELILASRIQQERTVLSEEKYAKVENYLQEFKKALEEDLNIPKALGIVWDSLKSNIPSSDKYDLAVSFDEVLGLRLAETVSAYVNIPDEINILIKQRNEARNRGDYKSSDEIRKKIMNLGYRIEDKPEGTKVSPILKNAS